jgi:hypothetical protein
VQVEPIKPTLKAPGTNLVTLNHDEPLSTFAFDFNLRRYSMGPGVEQDAAYAAAPSPASPTPTRAMTDSAVTVNVGRGLHSSTFRLNVSTFCWISWVHNFPPVY